MYLYILSLGTESGTGLAFSECLLSNEWMKEYKSDLSCLILRVIWLRSYHLGANSLIFFFTLSTHPNASGFEILNQAQNSATSLPLLTPGSICLEVIWRHSLPSQQGPGREMSECNWLGDGS